MLAADRSPRELSVEPDLDANTWTPTIEQVRAWPTRVLREVQRVDALGDAIDTSSQRAALGVP